MFKNIYFRLGLISSVAAICLLIALPRIPIKSDNKWLKVDSFIGGYSFSLLGGRYNFDLSRFRRGLDLNGGVRIVLQAELEGMVVGFVTTELNMDTKTGEVYFLAVHPDHQNLGIGTKLNDFALKKMKESGMKMAVAGTGGDQSHAPARKSYEKAGYVALPLVRYYKDL